MLTRRRSPLACLHPVLSGMKGSPSIEIVFKLKAPLDPDDVAPAAVLLAAIGLV